MSTQDHDQPQPTETQTQQDAAPPQEAEPQPQPAAQPKPPAEPSPKQEPEQTQGQSQSHAQAPEQAENAAPGKPAPLSSGVEAEIDAAMAKLGLGDAPAPQQKQPTGRDAVQPQGGRQQRVGRPRVVQGGREHRTGKVVSIGPSDIFIEFGPKELGVVEKSQFKEDELPKVGDDFEVVVTRFEPSESIFICAKPGTVQKADWEMLEAGQLVEARVTGVNKGGLELEVAKHRAFMPASQVALDRINDLSVFVGEKMTCKVQRVDRSGGGNIVLTRREILAEERANAAASLKETLKEGETLNGKVRKIMPFGAFVDLGGVDGLVHVSDMSHERIMPGEKNVARFVSEGQEVKVQVLNVDWDKNRIALGMKQLQADPFESAAEEVTEGKDLTGKVTRIADFGVFIEVAPGIEGLAHISELEWRRVNHPSDVVREGEVVQCRVLKVDAESRKVSLSLKALKEAPKQSGGGRGRGDRGGTGRSPEEIAAERDTPRLRRMREEAKKKAKQDQKKSAGGLGDIGGMGLGDLKL